MVARSLLALALLVPACAAEAPRSGGEPLVAELPPASAGLADTLAYLGALAPGYSPGTDLSIAVRDLVTGEEAALAADALHVSASSAKAYWVAAALDGAGVAAVTPYADAIFRSSDNVASGAVIDLVGPDGVNAFLWNEAGMPSTALTSWSYGRTRVAASSPRLMGSDNYTTARDAVTFLARLGDGTLLAPDATVALRGWLVTSPDDGVGGWLPARLPEPARSGAGHKGGWLPPGCCDDDTVYNTSNELGLVPRPDGGAYAVAILARRGRDYWGRQTRLVEHAACAIDRAIAHDEARSCERAGDPDLATGCGGLDYAGRCDGTVVVWCEDDALRSKDCAPSARTCGWASEAIGYDCVAGAAPAPSGCGGLDYAGRCDGTVVVWCEDEALRSKDCAPGGKACAWESDAVGYNCR